jgi:RNA polymerase sigma-32 factor
MKKDSTNQEIVTNRNVEQSTAQERSLATASARTTVPEKERLPIVLNRDKRVKAASKDLIPYDPLTAYLREIRRYPRLSREDEQELAIQYKEHGDVESAYKLISSTLWLVVRLAKEYERAARSLLDLIQEGNIGLMEAVKNFDPYRGVRFPSYASWWVKAYIIRYVIANWRMVKIGTTQAQRKLFFNLNKEKERLEREGFYPGPRLLAQNLDVKEHEIIEMEQRLSGSDVSFDAPLSNDSDSNLLGVLPHKGSTAEEELSKKQLLQQLSTAIAQFSETLSERDQTILHRRLLSEEKATLNDLSEEFGVSRERIRQLETRIKDKLKEFVKTKFHETMVDAGLSLEDAEFSD